MSPSLHAYSGKEFDVKLPSNLWYTNNSAAVSSIAADFDDGEGFQTLTLGQALNINYADTGLKTWTFRLTLVNSSVLYSHTEMLVLPAQNPYDTAGCGGCRFLRPGGPVFLTADDPYNGVYGQGWITVDYANSDLKLDKPLIVVEGFDPGHLLAPELEFGFSNFNTFTVGQLDNPSAFSQLTQLLRGTTQEYDIIYLDWFRGTDQLQRNALLLQRVIRWVNEQKALDGSTEPNVVLGQSMGGVIARWALRDMEDNSLDHDTRLFISWDAPQQGANVPLAYQHAARHANSLFVQSAIPTLLGGINAVQVARSALNLADVPAARQMLYNRALNNGNLNNDDHEDWQEELQTLGYPQQSRNIAVSNGSECASNQGFEPNATLLNVNGRANTRFLADLMVNGLSLSGPGLGFWGGLSFLTFKPQFLLGILPGRNDFNFEINCKAQPVSASTQIYKGKITYSKKILWLINVNTTITDRTRNADPSVLAIDGTQGGMYDTGMNLEDDAFKNWALKYSLTASNIPHFNFIPTTSALDIGSGTQALVLSDYQTRYVGGSPPTTPYNSPFDNFTTAYNEVLISNDEVNNNENHIQISARNGNWVAEELNGNTTVVSDCSDYCDITAISGENVVCNSEDYTVPFVSGASYSWFPTSSGLASFSANDNVFTVTRNGSSEGGITVSVIITSNCGVITLQRNVQIGGVSSTFNIVPYIPDQIDCWAVESFYMVEAQLVTGTLPSSYQWSTRPSGTTTETGIQSTSKFGDIYISTPGDYDILVRPVDGCGPGQPSIQEITVVYSCPWLRLGMLVSPNPGKDELVVSFRKDKTGFPVTDKKERVQYRLYDMGRAMPVKEWVFDSFLPQQRLNVRGIKPGLYLLMLVKDGHRESVKVILE